MDVNVRKNNSQTRRRNRMKSIKKQHKDKDLYIYDITDTSESSESEPSSPEEGPFKTNVPFVLELHAITKDNPSMPPIATEPIISPAATKIKKHKKKKNASDPGAKARRATLSTDSESLSDRDSSVAPSSRNLKEEFYDARESFVVMPESQIPAIVELAAQPETNLDPKALGLTATSHSEDTSPATQKKPSPIIKPTSPP